MYISSTFFFDAHIGQNFQHYMNYGENNNACYFCSRKWEKRIRIVFFFASWHDFFFLMYTSITFRTRVGRPKIRFGLVFCIFCTQKNISMCHSKIPFLEYISDFFSQKTYRDFFFLMYTSITFRTRVNIIKTLFWAKWQKFLLIPTFKNSFIFVRCVI